MVSSVRSTELRGMVARVGAGAWALALSSDAEKFVGVGVGADAEVGSRSSVGFWVKCCGVAMLIQYG